MPIGIIAEYNPFHNGHIYQLREAQKKWPNEKIVVFMSGKYVQRGELAIVPFRKRKQLAKRYGVHKVHKLPFSCSTQAAHVFAEKAVLLASEKKVTKLYFGSESNDVSLLMRTATTVQTNKSEYQRYLQAFLKQGLSFPKSANEALKKTANQDISLPNDILGLEYCKVIVKYNLPIEPFTLKRTVNFHASAPQGHFASASFIRQQVLANKDVSWWTPVKFPRKIKTIQDKYPRFQRIVKQTSPEKLAKIQLVSEGMENLFKKNITAKTYEEFVEKCTSKRYTHSRIKRTMLYVLLRVWK